MLPCWFDGVLGIPKSREKGVSVSLSWGRGGNVVGKVGVLLMVITPGNWNMWSCGGM